MRDARGYGNDVQIVNCQDAHPTSPHSSLHVYSCLFLYPLPPLHFSYVFYDLFMAGVSILTKKRKEVNVCSFFYHFACLMVYLSVKTCGESFWVQLLVLKLRGVKGRRKAKRDEGICRVGWRGSSWHFKTSSSPHLQQTYPFGSMHGVVRTTMSFLCHFSLYIIQLSMDIHFHWMCVCMDVCVNC